MPFVNIVHFFANMLKYFTYTRYQHTTIELDSIVYRSRVVRVFVLSWNEMWMYGCVVFWFLRSPFTQSYIYSDASDSSCILTFRKPFRMCCIFRTKRKLSVRRQYNTAFEYFARKHLPREAHLYVAFIVKLIKKRTDGELFYRQTDGTLLNSSRFKSNTSIDSFYLWRDQSSSFFSFFWKEKNEELVDELTFGILANNTTLNSKIARALAFIFHLEIFVWRSILISIEAEYRICVPKRPYLYIH